MDKFLQFSLRDKCPKLDKNGQIHATVMNQTNGNLRKHQGGVDLATEGTDIFEEVALLPTVLNPSHDLIVSSHSRSMPLTSFSKPLVKIEDETPPLKRGSVSPFCFSHR